MARFEVVAALTAIHWEKKNYNTAIKLKYPSEV